MTLMLRGKFTVNEVTKHKETTVEK